MEIKDFNKMFPNLSDIAFMRELVELLGKYNMGERVGIEEGVIAGHLYSNIASLKTVMDFVNLEKKIR